MKADPNKIKRKLAIAKGQLEGIQKMVEEDAYCIDISNQLMATIQILKNVNLEVISAHLNECVRNAKNDEEADQKIKEITLLLKRMEG